MHTLSVLMEVYMKKRSIFLAAAIPASIGYNRIGAAYARLGHDMASWVEERAISLISRPAEVTRDEGLRRRAEGP